MTDRIRCTSEHPWDRKNPKARVAHEGAFEVGDQRDGWPGGDIVRYRCPNCGEEWTAELAQ